MPGRTRLAVIGGGWAGLAAAVEACQAGAEVTLFEMASTPGGRARTVSAGEHALDNGQHILIGAYSASLSLLRTLGVDPSMALLRLPLQLRYPEQAGLQLRAGHPVPSFALAVLRHAGWPWRARLSLLRHCTVWALRRFECPEALSVAELCMGLADEVRADLVWPLCVAALNTPAERASARVFLRVLRDALFSGPGSADLLLPRLGLSDLLAHPAAAWLSGHGARLRMSQRVEALHASDAGAWLVDGERFDAVVLACSSVEAARLTQDLAPGWSGLARALRFEPIVTVYLESPGSALPSPMLALREGPADPAQFAFDLGQLDPRRSGQFSLVVSGAAAWTARGLDACAAACLQQAQRQLRWASTPRLLRVLAEKRATFACSPGLARPGSAIAPGLYAAGDYVDGPYPATLEGAVRAGMAAARQALPRSASR